jgi:6-pyruvoyltetrahydropterin/6-carboxytetrahydropterin synthase
MDPLQQAQEEHQLRQLFIVSKDFTFEASHVLPRHPGKCSKLHGHSWKLTVAIRGPINPQTDFVADFGDLSKIVNQRIIEQIDHQHLGLGNIVRVSAYAYDETSGLEQRVAGEVCSAALGPKFYPTSENLVKAFVRMLQPLVVELGTNIELYEVTIHETCTSACTWRTSNV